MRSLLAVANKPQESSLTILAELHRAVMELAPEERRDDAAVNRAAARVADLERRMFGGAPAAGTKVATARRHRMLHDYAWTI